MSPYSFLCEVVQTLFHVVLVFSILSKPNSILNEQVQSIVCSDPVISLNHLVHSGELNKF